MFPPGRAMLATNPVATASPLIAITMGIVVVACLAARSGCGVRDDKVYVDAYQFRREIRKSVVLVFSPPVLDGEVLALDVAKISKPLPQCFDVPCV